MVAKQYGGRKALNWISAILLRLGRDGMLIGGDLRKCPAIAFERHFVASELLPPTDDYIEVFWIQLDQPRTSAGFLAGDQRGA